MTGDLSLGAAHKEVAKALVDALATQGSDADILTALSSKSLILVNRLAEWYPNGLTLGMPTSESGGRELVETFKSVLGDRGLANAIGTPAGEGFLWAVTASEPILQLKASSAAVNATATAIATANVNASIVDAVVAAVEKEKTIVVAAAEVVVAEVVVPVVVPDHHRVPEAEPVVVEKVLAAAVPEVMVAPVEVVTVPVEVEKAEEDDDLDI